VVPCVKLRSVLRIAHLLAGLSNATDVANAQPHGSALRTASIAMALSTKTPENRTDQAELFYVSLLRFLGCTAYAHEASGSVVGDDMALHRAFASMDTNAPLKTALAGQARDLPSDSLKLIAAFISSRSDALSELATSQCDVAVHMSRRLSMSERICSALRETYERWDGRGEPRKLPGHQLAPTTRIVQVASATESLLRKASRPEARARLREFAGHRLDPAIVAIALENFDELAEIASAESAWELTVDRLSPEAGMSTDVTLDDVALVFADYVDLKSVHTVGHSSGVAALARSAGALLGLDEAEQVKLRHAALLHDLGMVGISTGILEKPAPLTAMERERMHLHPYDTARLLRLCEAFAPISHIAGSHHERSDASGYPLGLPNQSLCLASRILCAAEAYHALTERRAYRPAHTNKEAAAIVMTAAASGALDTEAAHAVLRAGGRAPERGVSKKRETLTERETEVLRHIARGKSEKETAGLLSISARTVHHHVTHIYKKIGVSSRAAAALYAVERGLL
jgi:HD-GYP domain-containing protein (c-di-GMP phosphodiesterase class II)